MYSQIFHALLILILKVQCRKVGRHLIINCCHSNSMVGLPSAAPGNLGLIPGTEYINQTFHPSRFGPKLIKCMTLELYYHERCELFLLTWDGRKNALCELLQNAAIYVRDIPLEI